MRSQTRQCTPSAPRLKDKILSAGSFGQWRLGRRPIAKTQESFQALGPRTVIGDHGITMLQDFAGRPLFIRNDQSLGASGPLVPPLAWAAGQSNVNALAPTHLQPTVLAMRLACWHP
eukprot:2111666-Pyramimonas_sp.AAC.1